MSGLSAGATAARIESFNSALSADDDTVHRPGKAPLARRGLLGYLYRVLHGMSGERQQPTNLGDRRLTLPGPATSESGHDQRSRLQLPLSALRSGSGRPSSHKHPLGGPPHLAVPEVRHQDPKRRNQNALGLFLAHRPTAPPLPDRPLTDAPLQPDDVPDTRAGRTR
jgi:hypothetical protein